MNTCAKPGCAAVPTHREDIRSTLGIFGPQGIQRRYILCERHDLEYFTRSGWLTDKQSERIKRELIPFNE